MDLKTRRPGHPVRAWSSAHFASSAVGYGDAFPSWPLLYSSPRALRVVEHARGSPLQRRASQARRETDGGVKKQNEPTRAYAQQLVTTRLLDCLHDPVGRPSRLQGFHPRAR